jgi:hypothetical protein
MPPPQEVNVTQDQRDFVAAHALAGILAASDSKHLDPQGQVSHPEHQALRADVYARWAYVYAEAMEKARATSKARRSLR